MHETVTISPRSTRVEVRDRSSTVCIRTNVVSGGVPYEGDYEVTPNRETQTLQTAGLYMRGNVTVNPIPSNYGLIEWNGSALRVS